QVLEHVTDPIEFLRAMARCTRSGGLVIISVPAEDGALGASVNYTLNLPPHHLTHWTDSALTFAMTRVGLVDVNLHQFTLDRDHEAEAIAQFLARIVGGPNFRKKLIRLRLAERLFLAVLRAAAKPLRRGIVTPFARGHSVVAVGQKPT